MIILSIHSRSKLDSAFDVFPVQEMQALNYRQFTVCFNLLLHQTFTDSNIIGDASRVNRQNYHG